MTDSNSAATTAARDHASEREPSRHTFAHRERGATHGLSLLLWLLEQSRWTLAALPMFPAAAVTLLVDGGIVTFVTLYAFVPFAALLSCVGLLVFFSRRRDAGPANWDGFLEWRDPAIAARWRGKKIPMEVAYEAYIGEKLDFKADPRAVMLARNRLFRFCFTWGDFGFFARRFLGQLLGHGSKADRGDIVPVYDRGNDFYGWFLGETMVYTTGLFHHASESLETAQMRKLETVCRYVQMKPGDRHLDIGCGWGALLTYAASRFGTHSTGITLAKEQADWAREVARNAGVSDRVDVLVDDYRNLPRERYDKITCLEMAEHVGVKNFQKFLLQVKSMLEDDGIFYLQIAGLRRAWHYEDLVWGLFMAKYIFPGADASCPLGFVVSQAERAGFEVHRVENCGTHYSLTIQKWYENWCTNRAEIVARYGERWFRLWSLFLSWSALIAAQGSSALFMITLTKNTKNDKSSVTFEEGSGVPFSRTERWIGREPIATQQ